MRGNHAVLARAMRLLAIPLLLVALLGYGIAVASVPLEAVPLDEPMSATDTEPGFWTVANTLLTFVSVVVTIVGIFIGIYLKR